MAISISEFRTAMETYGAKMIDGVFDYKSGSAVPCFIVKNIYFKHSGSYYVAIPKLKAFAKVRDAAMNMLGIEYPGNEKDFWYNEIRSIRGIITFVAILEECYTEELVDEVINETYRRLFSSHAIQIVPKRNFINPKMNELYNLVSDFDNLINPFPNAFYNKEKASDYLDKLGVFVKYAGEMEAEFMIQNSGISITYFKKIGEIGYIIKYTEQIESDGKCNEILAGHYISNIMNKRKFDEIVFFEYISGNSVSNICKYNQLHINLSLNSSWTENGPEKAKFVTADEIKEMVWRFGNINALIRRKIGRHMIKNIDFLQ